MADPASDEKEARKAKRAERRQKQRLANDSRALKMRKARLADTNGELGLSGLTLKSKAKAFHIGCSGWFYWHWKGGFYKEDLPTNKWFSHYQKHFKTVELNAPFYSWPTVASVKSWIKQAESQDFLYTVKVCELVTHVRKFKGTKTLIKDFGYIADLLGPQMGCFLFQLPPSFQYTPARLRMIVEQLDPSRRNVVEFRHKSWWNKDVYTAFRKAGIIFCSCSGPSLPDELIKTADEIYVRFHGIKQWYRYDYSKEELQIWAQRIKDSGAGRSWIYFNNDFNEYAIKNARMLSRLLK